MPASIKRGIRSTSKTPDVGKRILADDTDYTAARKAFRTAARMWHAIASCSIKISTAALQSRRLGTRKEELRLIASSAGSRDP